MTGDEFSAQVGSFVAQSRARMLAVFKESAKRTISLAQAGIPVDTGFARASLVVTLDGMPQVEANSRPAAGQTYGPSISVDAIAGVEFGGTIYAGWTASYVPFLENGSSQQAPQGFIRLAALQWQQTVETVAAELEARITNG